MLFNQFPREIGPPRKVVDNKQDYLKYINIHNGKKKAIYTSIYSFKTYMYEPYYKPDYNSAIVDKLFFDFDFKSCDAWKECNKLHTDCDKNNIKHTIIFSGRGYHLYIFIKQKDITNKKEAIRGGQEYFINKLNLSVDKQVIGNVAQLARIPNTYNIKAKLFCIPLSRYYFSKGDVYIKKLAEKQNFIKDIIMNKSLFDISEWDKETESDWFDISNSKFSIEVMNTKTENISPCIQKLLDKKNCGWKGRYLIILYFKELGFSKEEIFKKLKECLSPAKLRHCIKEENQLQYLFRRNDLLFPSCQKIKEDGFCPEKCKFYNDMIYK